MNQDEPFSLHSASGDHIYRSAICLGQRPAGSSGNGISNSFASRKPAQHSVNDNVPEWKACMLHGNGYIRIFSLAGLEDAADHVDGEGSYFQG